MGEGWCVTMWVSYSGKLLPHCPTFPCTHTHTHTHACLQSKRHTHHYHRRVWLCHHPNLCKNTVIRTKWGQPVQARQPKPLCPGDGVETVCVYVCLMVAIRLQFFITVNGPRTSQVLFTSSVADHCYMVTNPDTTVANVYSSGSTQSPPSNWKISVCSADVSTSTARLLDWRINREEVL